MGIRSRKWVRLILFSPSVTCFPTVVIPFYIWKRAKIYMFVCVCLFLDSLFCCIGLFVYSLTNNALSWCSFMLFCSHVVSVSLELIQWHLQNYLLKSWLELFWIYRSSWKELRSWPHWSLLFMNMEYLSIYLVLWYLYQNFVIFLI